MSFLQSNGWSQKDKAGEVFYIQLPERSAPTRKHKFGAASRNVDCSCHWASTQWDSRRELGEDRGSGRWFVIEYKGNQTWSSSRNKGSLTIQMICPNLMWKPQHYECHHFSHSASILISSHCLTVQCVGYFSRSVHLSTNYFTHTDYFHHNWHIRIHRLLLRENWRLFFIIFLQFISLTSQILNKYWFQPFFCCFGTHSQATSLFYAWLILIGFTMYSYTWLITGIYLLWTPYCLKPKCMQYPAIHTNYSF